MQELEGQETSQGCLCVKATMVLSGGQRGFFGTEEI